MERNVTNRLMVKLIIISILFFITTLTVSGQIKSDVLEKISQHINDKLDKGYHPSDDSLKNFCRIGCVFTSFAFDKNGKVVNLAFSDRSPLFIQTALAKAIQTLETDTELISLLQSTNKRLILPLLYYYQKGCHLPNERSEFKKGNSEAFWEKYAKSTLDIDHTADTVYEMLHFQNEKLGAADCILISPYRVAVLGNSY